MNWCDTQYHLIYHTKWHLHPDRSTEYPFLKCQMDRFPLYVDVFFFPLSGPSWPWSYCSWIYNYLCNDVVSSILYQGEMYNILRVLRFPPPIKLTATIYNWILLNVALNTIKQTNFPLSPQNFYRTCLRVTWQVSHMNQKLFTLRECLCLTPIFSFPCFKNSKLALFLGSESTFFQLEMLNFDSIYFKITWFYLREFRGHISVCSIYKGDWKYT